MHAGRSSRGASGDERISYGRRRGRRGAVELQLIAAAAGVALRQRAGRRLRLEDRHAVGADVAVRAVRRRVVRLKLERDGALQQVGGDSDGIRAGLIGRRAEEFDLGGRTRIRDGRGARDASLGSRCCCRRAIAFAIAIAAVECRRGAGWRRLGAAAAGSPWGSGSCHDAR